MVVNVVILRERDVATIKATDLQPGIYVTSFPDNYHNHCQYEDVGPYHEWGGEKAGHSNCFVCGTSTLLHFNQATPASRDMYLIMHGNSC